MADSLTQALIPGLALLVPTTVAFSQVCTQVPGQVNGLVMRLPWRTGEPREPFYVTQGYCHAGWDHTGYQVDFAMPEWTPVIAISSGTVVQIGDNGSTCPNGCGDPTLDGGIFVKLQHTATDGVRYNSSYLHLRQRLVNCGEFVPQGGLLGYSGNTGYSTGPHLHLHIRRANPSTCPTPSEVENVRPVPMVGRPTGSPQSTVITDFVEGAYYTAVEPGQWTVINLHPSFATGSSGSYGVSASQQVGLARVGTFDHAVLWSSSAASAIDLAPAGATRSVANGVDGGRQVGQATFSNHQHAGLWSGTAASWIDLNPGGAGTSSANGVSGPTQVGSASFVEGLHAGKWQGSPGSWVDLNPTGASSSEAYGIDGSAVVGYAIGTFGGPVASLWANGTAGTWTNLDAGTFGSGSYACGISGGQQVGWAWTNFGAPHASLWHGSAASRVDLNPIGASASMAYGVSRGQQVGSATIGGADHASFWTGTAGSWVDLHALLAPEFEWSYARGIYNDGASTFVVGWGHNNATGRDEALLWVRAPHGGDVDPCYANCDGSTAGPVLNVNDFICFETHFAAGDSYANCDGSTTLPVFNVNDFICFQTRFAQGCP